jgi:hypothetical protein
MRSRLAAAWLAASLASGPAWADHHIGHVHLAPPTGALQTCRTGMLVSLPAHWQAGDGAVVLVTMRRSHGTARDALLSALLAQDAAVVELEPLACNVAQDARAAAIADATDALAAMTRTAGAGLIVAIGLGPGARAVLDLVRAAPAGAGGPRFAAAIALGDGAPALALGAPAPAREGAPVRLAALCAALAVVVDGARGAAGAGLEGCAAAAIADAAPAVSSASGR